MDVRQDLDERWKNDVRRFKLGNDVRWILHHSNRFVWLAEPQLPTSLYVPINYLGLDHAGRAYSSLSERWYLSMAPTLLWDVCAKNFGGMDKIFQGTIEVDMELHTLDDLTFNLKLWLYSVS